MTASFFSTIWLAVPTEDSPSLENPFYLTVPGCISEHWRGFQGAQIAGIVSGRRDHSICFVLVFLSSTIVVLHAAL
jgi:hypothetical protein